MNRKISGSIKVVLMLVFFLLSCREKKSGPEFISGVKQPTVEEVAYFTERAKFHNDGNAAFKLSSYYLRFERNEKIGYYWLLKAADYGDPDALAGRGDRDEAWRVWNEKYGPYEP